MKEFTVKKLGLFGPVSIDDGENLVYVFAAGDQGSQLSEKHGQGGYGCALVYQEVDNRCPETTSFVASKNNLNEAFRPMVRSFLACRMYRNNRRLAGLIKVEGESGLRLPTDLKSLSYVIDKPYFDEIRNQWAVVIEQQWLALLDFDTLANNVKQSG